MPQSPVASIILPTHNRPELLSEALESVCDQDDPRWEVLVIDDGSTPPVSISHFAEYYGKIRLYRNESPVGGAHSKAIGAQLARGRYLTYLDDDDLYDRCFLRDAIDSLERLPDVDVLFVDVEWFGKDAEKEGGAHKKSRDWIVKRAAKSNISPGVIDLNEKLFESLLERVPMAFQRPFVRSTFIEKIGFHDKNVLLWDCEWALRASLYGRCAFLNRPLYLQRAAGQGYYSRSGTSTAQAVSDFEIINDLYKKHFSKIKKSGRKKVVIDAKGRRAQRLSYAYAKSGKPLKCLPPFVLGQFLRPRIREFRTLPLAIYHMLRSNLAVGSTRPGGRRGSSEKVE